MAQTLEYNQAAVTAAALTVPSCDVYTENIRDLDDEPNDVGGLTAAELKATFDRTGEQLVDYINDELIPAIIAADATEEARAAAEAERVSNEQERVSNEAARAANEQTRASSEQARQAAEAARADETAGIVAEASQYKDRAERYAYEAASSRSQAQQYAVSAANSQNAAASSASAAASSESAAADSVSAAAGSENAAAASASAAAGSESAAANSASAAAGSESAAANSASAAAGSASAALSSSTLAQSYAKGGTNTRTGEDTDNAKYYAEQAQDAVARVDLPLKRGEGTNALIEGSLTGDTANTAIGNYSHAEGRQCAASGSCAHAEGERTAATGNAHAEGYRTSAGGTCSHAEGVNSAVTRDGYASHAEGWACTATGTSSHVEGYHSTANGYGSHAEGGYATASGSCAHAEGERTAATGNAHAEGYRTSAGGTCSHAEGVNSAVTRDGYASHAEGWACTATGTSSHVEGYHSTANGYGSHAEGGYATASGKYSHAEGLGTNATRKSQHVFGEHNVPDASGASTDVRGDYVEIVGNGSDDNNLSNARTLDWNGNETLAGKLTLGAGPTGSMDAVTKQYVDGKTNKALCVPATLTAAGWTDGTPDAETLGDAFQDDWWDANGQARLYLKTMAMNADLAKPDDSLLFSKSDTVRILMAAFNSAAENSFVVQMVYDTEDGSYQLRDRSGNEMRAETIAKFTFQVNMTQLTLPQLVAFCTAGAEGISAVAQTVAVTGVKADETAQLIQPVAAKASEDAYDDADVHVIAQAANSLTFAAETTPQNDLTVYVCITELEVSS